MWEVKSHCERHQWASYADEPCPHCAGEKVPALVKDFDEQVAPDLKNAFNLAKDMFTGDFFERHGFVDKPVTNLPSYPSSIPTTTATDCKVCAGVRKVGAPGYQVPCPACSACKTCQGRGMVGMPGHEVACPACNLPR